MLIRRGRRVADYLGAECFGVYVCPVPSLKEIPVQEREAIERHLNFARNLRIETRILYGEDIPQRLVEFARSQHVTQIFLARQKQARRWFREDLTSQVLRLARDTQVIVVAERPLSPIAQDGL
jgi:two-component system sensor histidine kinase KdpD